MLIYTAVHPHFSINLRHARAREKGSTMRTTVQSEDPNKPTGFTPNHIDDAQVGDTMFWFNEDRNTQHLVQCDSPISAPWTGVIEPQNASSLVCLDEAGTYRYHCALHTGETGTIKVS